MATAPFTFIPTLAAVAVMYPQGERIADKVMPRVPVLTPTFAYTKYSLGDAFKAPDTRVGRKSAPNQIDWGSDQTTDKVNDEGLDAPVPNADIKVFNDAKAAGVVVGPDPLATATGLVMGAVLNRREKRVADAVFNLANYAVGCKTTLSAGSQWSDYANSDPIGAINDMLDGMVVRPNHGVLGQPTWAKLKRHPKVISSLYGSASTRGSARLVDLAEELGLKEIHVGQAFTDTAAVGQPSQLQRCWGKGAAFYYQDMQATTEAGVTFALTAQWGDRIAGTIEDANIGLRGGVRVRAGESVKELVTANDLGCYFANAVA